MNRCFFSGRVCTVPKLSYVPIGNRNIFMCMFVIATIETENLLDSEENPKKQKEDYLQCLLLGTTAKRFSEEYDKGCKVILQGKMKNFSFEDANLTPHFTNVFFVDTVENGDTESALGALRKHSKAMDNALMSNLERLYEEFELICKNGFMCVDESNYYKLATLRME